MMDDWAPLQPEPWTPSLLGSTDRPRSESFSLEIWARDGSIFDGPKGVMLRGRGTIFMEAPARVAQQTFHQPTIQPTNGTVAGTRLPVPRCKRRGTASNGRFRGEPSRGNDVKARWTCFCPGS